MSEQKQWISHDEIEVTKPVSDFVYIDALKAKIEDYRNILVASEKQVVDVKEVLLRLEGELADLLSTPNRPEKVEEVKPEEIIDPLFVEEKPIQ